jgi:hypothetical protein
MNAKDNRMLTCTQLLKGAAFDLISLEIIKPAPEIIPI